VPRGPVLLVDDVVDSGWTLTLLAVMLQQHGSGLVYPFALAKASPRGG
jgi:ATP-dependent DNA helicase RecQ